METVFYSLQRLQDRGYFGLITRHLLSRFGSRIRFFDILDDVLDKKDVGYYPRKDMIYMACQLPHADHEIAHMVEIAHNRILLPDWGLRLYNGISNERPSSLVAGYAREVRVRAIQSLLYKEHQRNNSILDNFTWVDAMTNITPYGRFKNRKDVIDWTNDLHERTLKNWNIDKIECVWNERVDFILNWMN